MRSRTIPSAMGLMAAGLALGAAPAAADTAMAPHGDITISYHGDPARGCAAVGLCGIQGVIILRPQTAADLVRRGQGRHDVVFEGLEATVRARRTDAGSSGNCINAAWPGFEPWGLSLSRPAGGAVVARLAPGASPSKGMRASPRRP